MTWYYAENGTQRGPVSLEQLQSLVQSGTVKPTDLVWRDGMTDWMPAGQVSELSNAAGPMDHAPPSQPTATPSYSPDPYQPPQAVPGNVYQQPVYPQYGTSGAAIAALICGLCVLLCGVICGIPAIICGHVALSQIKASGGQIGGRGMAITGLVFGYLSIVGTLLYFVLVGFLAASGQM
jgi:hypothetical protein